MAGILVDQALLLLQELQRPLPDVSLVVLFPGYRLKILILLEVLGDSVHCPLEDDLPGCTVGVEGHNYVSEDSQFAFKTISHTAGSPLRRELP